MVYTFNLSPGEAEASRSHVNSRPGLHGKFQAIQGWIVRPYIFKKHTMGLWKWLCNLELLFQRTGLPSIHMAPVTPVPGDQHPLPVSPGTRRTDGTQTYTQAKHPDTTF